MNFLSSAQFTSETELQHRPSFYELLIADNLDKSLYPAAKYALTILARRNARAETALWRFDELFLCLKLALESYHYYVHDSTFAMKFYGMKRAPLHNPRSLKGRLARYVLFVLIQIVVPYIKRKLDALYDRLRVGSGRNRLEPASRSLFGGGGADNNPAPNAPSNLLTRLSQHAKTVFVAIYPSAHAVWTLAAVAVQMAYVFEHTHFYSPLLWAERCRVQRITRVDVMKLEESTRSRDRAVLRALARWGVNNAVVRGVLQAAVRVWGWVGYAFPLFVFSFKAVEWWYKEPRETVSEVKPPPPPPRPELPSGMVVSLPTSPTVCALCKRTRTNPTLAPSGFVYCYTCIFEFVDRYGCCPLSLQPATVDDLRRLYEAT